ncbi:hypothetical protein IAT38_003195 [Cryptococcus sp. DSM 104549]
MLLPVLLSALVAPVTLALKATLDPSLHRDLLLNGRPQIGLWRALLNKQRTQVQAPSSTSDQQRPFTPPSHSLSSIFEPHCFDQPISHFDSSVNGTFCHRYWIDASSYEPGGPVYLLDGGETSGEDRLAFLDKGILQILSNATKGLSIVLEHRYYGESVPVSSLSTDNLRFLNNAEALEDSAYFIEHFKPPSSLGILHEPLAFHPNNTPWIYYGGSYAGARAAHMRTQYPDLVWGAIASSAVTHAEIDFHNYYRPIMRYGPQPCLSVLEDAVEYIDTILDHPAPFPKLLKGLFGLSELASDQDFADVISSPLGYWQAQNWDPDVGSLEFDNFCAALTAGGAGSRIGLIRVPAAVVNYGRYVKEKIVSQCPRSDGHPASDIEECFGTEEDSKFRETDLDQTWRLWIFQVCTQWGYFMPAPEEGLRIISNRVTLDYTAKICKQAFPPGEHFSVPAWPDVEEVNARGDFGISADRLAFIDGDRDPWREMTPQSDAAPKRESTVNQPVHLIFNGVHHYDENGLANHSEEPARIRDVHEFEKLFISEWLAQWKERKLAV